MQDYEYLFSTELHKRLKEKVKGKVWVKIYHDELHVNIIPDENGELYAFVMTDMASRILNGLSTSYIVYDILKDYRNYVNKQYFK